MRLLSLSTLAVGLAVACSEDASSNPPPSAVAFPLPPTGVSEISLPDGAQLAFGGEIVRFAARPMVTGTLAVTQDGKYAIAADSERDRIVVADLEDRSVRRFDLGRGVEPGRTVTGAVLDGAPHAYTVLRRDAALVDLDVQRGEVLRVPTCQEPRGVTFDDAKRQVYVACGTGELVTYDAATWEELRRVVLARDLRDVVVTEDGLLVSRFGTAELLVVDGSGVVTSLTKPDVHPTCTEPTVLHRAVSHGGELYLAHQLASTEQVLGRNGDSSCEVAQSAVVLTHAPLAQVSGLTAEDEDYWGPFSLTRVGSTGTGNEAFELTQGDTLVLNNGAGPMDLAVSSKGRVAVTLAGNFWTEDLPMVVTWGADSGEGGVSSLVTARISGMVTSINFDATGQWVALSREPAGLYFEDGSTLFFGGSSVNNTAFSLFHMNTGIGVSCATCHPEGGEDGHVWQFPRGLRRTLSLGFAAGSDGGYNWDQSQEYMSELVSSVLNQQMAYDFHVSSEQQSQLEDWLHHLPVPGPGVIVDAAAVAKGRELFFGTLNCDSCHGGETLRGSELQDIGTGAAYVAPSLLGVGARANLLHDGCAATLADVFGSCGGRAHRLDERTDGEVHALLTFLSTL